jgi:zinc/manganese transport system ATP-binding protein
LRAKGTLPVYLSLNVMLQPIPTAVIHAQDLCVGYDGKTPVINHFSGDIASGQFVGVFGANGAGKTTLLCCMLGLIKPLSGELHILGSAPQRGHTHIGYLPQGLPNLPVNVSGAALLAATLGGHRWGLPILTAQQREEIARVVSFVGADALVDRPFMQLSGGERRRLLLAQALLGSPQLLLLDEPLANLDPHYQYTLIELLARVQTELGITLLLTAHDINPLIGVMTQVLYLAQGKAVLGTVDEILTSDVLSHLYESPIEVIRQQGRVFVLHSKTGQAENASCH